MTFDTDYPNRKDHRQQYLSGSRRFDRSCRHQGSCSYCSDGRQHKRRRDEQDADAQIEEFKHLAQIEEEEQAEREWDQMWQEMDQDWP